MFKGKRLIVFYFTIIFVLVGCAPGEGAAGDSPTGSDGVTVEPAPSDMPDTPEPTEVPPRESGATVFRNIFYGRQRLHLFLPDEASSLPDKRYPVIFLVHGWSVPMGEEGTITDKVTNLANDLGYAAVTIDYDDSGRFGRESPWTTLADTTCALAWVFASAEDYGLDVTQMVAFGSSWGGIMTSVLAAADDHRDFLQECPHQLPEGKPFLGSISYGSIPTGVPGPGFSWGSEDFAEEYVQDITGGQESTEVVLEITHMLGQVPPLEWAEDESLTEEAKSFAMLFPAYWIDPGDPPALVMMGERDSKFEADLIAESGAFVDLLESVGVSASLVVVPEATHSWFGSGDAAAWQEPIASFLDDILDNE